MKKLPLVLTLAALTVSTSLYAEEKSAIAINAGAFDAFDDETSAELAVEYRFAPLASAFNLIPAVGIAVNDEGGYWAHAGLRYDVDITNNWILTPHIAVVGYEQGGGYDLGHGLLFRSGLEVAYQFDESRLGVGIYHLSNAGLGNSNPGEESVYLSYSFQLNN